MWTQLTLLLSTASSFIIFTGWLQQIKCFFFRVLLFGYSVTNFQFCYDLPIFKVCSSLIVPQCSTELTQFCWDRHHWKIIAVCCFRQRLCIFGVWCAKRQPKKLPFQLRTLFALKSSRSFCYELLVLIKKIKYLQAWCKYRCRGKRQSN